MAHVVGIDVAKHRHDVHRLEGADEERREADAERLANSAEERLLVGTLIAAGLPVVVVNPCQVRDFARRALLIEMRTMETNQLKKAALAIKDLESSLEFIEKRLKKIDDELDEHIHNGPQTARVLVLDLPELGDCSRQKSAALVGLAPMNDDSGKFRGDRGEGE